MNIMHIFIPAVIALPVVAWSLLWVRAIKRKREQALVIDVEGEKAPTDLNEAKNLPLKKQAQFLMAAVTVGLFLLHILTNEANPHNDQSELSKYRAYMERPQNVNSIKKIAEGGERDD